MAIGRGKLALRQPLATTAGSGAESSDRDHHPTTISGLVGWWDGSSPAFVRGPDSQPGVAWFGQCEEIVDRSDNGDPLRPFRFMADQRTATIHPRLSGLLGGVGQVTNIGTLPKPVLDPDLGLVLGRGVLGRQEDWTVSLVWSRPNLRQGTIRDGDPIVLLRAGSTTILQVDSGPPNRLTLLPAAAAAVLGSSLARRHTHSVVLRYRRSHGIDVWLDDVKVVEGVPNTLPWSPEGPTLFLHDSGFMGAAQCWFHEAIAWNRGLTDSEISVVLTYLQRWYRGRRRGVTLLVNGQSNAINYSLNDGAADLLARGIAWHLGSLAWNIIATTGDPFNHTMQSGHGLYQVQNGAYPGAFLRDPADGSNPSTWQLGEDGQAVEAAIQSLSPDDRDDIRAIVWPWNETDSLRGSSELSNFVAAVTRFAGLERVMIGKSASELPLVCWSAIPYGTVEGTAMHRRAVHLLANTAGMNTVLGNPQTSDSNQRGAIWSEATGLATGGDPAHRDGDDNRRLARLAAPVVARAILASSGPDSLTAIPLSLPRRGGPRLIHVHRQSNTTLIATVEHDAGTDLKVPRQSMLGRGFAVTDGGQNVGQGTLVRAVSCERINATQLKLVLEQPLQHASFLCALHYPYGGEAIGRGNAVTDNFADCVKPEGWDIAADLGSAWRLDCPLAATLIPLQLSDTVDSHAAVS